MDTARHDSEDRITIASLSGATMRRAVQLARAEIDLATAVAKLHGISRDPHLLAHAVSTSDDWRHPHIVELLKAAGADMAAMAENLALHDKRNRRGMPLGNLADGLR